MRAARQQKAATIRAAGKWIVDISSLPEKGKALVLGWTPQI
jgi:hypothetical protein